MILPEIFSGSLFPRLRRGALVALAGLFATAGQAAEREVLSVIQTPPESEIAEWASEPSLHGLALANLVASNCTLEGLEAGDAALLAGTAQQVASHMGVGQEEYFSVYIGSALREMGAAGACDIYAESTRSLVLILKERGGAVLKGADRE